MQTPKCLLGDIRHGLNGFSALARFYVDAKDSLSSTVEIDMQATRWIDADMCAPFGALICALKQRQVAVKLVNLQDNVKEILLKNGFLSSHGG